MLQLQTVAPELLGIIQFLMKQPILQSFRLVGGTALALQLGHRKSIDIDLFGQSNLSGDEINDVLNDYGKVISISKSKNINIFTLNNIKIDFVNYKYPWIDDTNELEGIRLASPKEIGAMKINAITGRGSMKDFVDLFYLLKKFSLQDLLGFFEQKYFDGSVFLAIKSLAYFKDAENQQMPVLFEEVSWLEMKNEILKEHKKISL